MSIFIGKICVTKESGEPCKFPWIYSFTGKKYEGCADTDGSGAWCPTKLGTSLLDNAPNYLSSWVHYPKEKAYNTDQNYYTLFPL